MSAGIAGSEDPTTPAAINAGISSEYLVSSRLVSSHLISYEE
ncbi:hypothetical protein TIFTF001_009020 [Ficus carica]|uniref:Uncharacterized protein n=1 Tax=Ficus carica TaxID=3494 RepID=A0AA88D3A9_FICCA|nr:hypothetical protein TIFTF001_009020 [Ficus carica]